MQARLQMLSARRMLHAESLAIVSECDAQPESFGTSESAVDSDNPKGKRGQ